MQYITTETNCYHSDLKTSKYKICYQNQHPNTFAAQTKLHPTEHLTVSSGLELNTEHIFNYQITKILNIFLKSRIDQLMNKELALYLCTKVN